jgi:hypothetical protein
MANQNIGTPRFYTDMPNYLMARGVAQNGEFDVVATGGSGATATRGLQTGTEAELFDMKPLNKVDFDTSGDTDSQVLITIDLQSENFKTNYIAILNHNLVSAVGKIRIFAGDIASDVASVDGSACETADVNWGTIVDAGNVVEVVNADTRTKATDDKSVVIEPGTDGTTIIRFTEQSLRYWAIQFEGNTTNTGAATNGTWGSTDLYVGCVMIGEYFEMPHAPDLAVKRSIMFDQTKLQESVGGQRYSNMTSFGPQSESGTTKSPFKLASKNYTMYGGRLAYDMKFSYLSASDVMPLEYASVQYGSDTVVEDLWNITHGSHIPFIFSIDKDSEGTGAESEHIFARFGQNSLDMTQVANDVFDIQLRIEEEF